MSYFYDHKISLIYKRICHKNSYEKLKTEKKTVEQFYDNKKC